MKAEGVYGRSDRMSIPHANCLRHNLIVAKKRPHGFIMLHVAIPDIMFGKKVQQEKTMKPLETADLLRIRGTVRCSELRNLLGQ